MSDTTTVTLGSLVAWAASALALLNGIGAVLALSPALLCFAPAFVIATPPLRRAVATRGIAFSTPAAIALYLVATVLGNAIYLFG